MDGVFRGARPSGHDADSLPPGELDRLTALVIDDNGRFRTALTGLLSRAGLAVVEAADGAQGLALARASQPDVVITDIYMPGVGGLPTIEHLRRDRPGIKIIAMSGADAPAIDLAHRSAVLGADYFLSKPFDAAELLDQIGRLCPRGLQEPGA
jgi:CheY-like chemotaxis protein